jgi:hypothetical protein
MDHAKSRNDRPVQRQRRSVSGQEIEKRHDQQYFPENYHD